MQQHVQERKRRKLEEAGGGSSDTTSSSIASTRDQEGDERFKRKFRQQQVIGQDYGERQFKAKSGLLNKVFGKTSND